MTVLVYFLTIALENVCALDSISWFELLAKSETPIPNTAKVSQTFPNSLLSILCALLLPLLYKKSINALVLSALTIDKIVTFFN